MADTNTAPPAIAALPKNHAGYHVPWFVEWFDGVPDFRVADSRKFRDALRFGLCWMCGKPRGRYGAFVIGPMCAVNRVSAEPPSHEDCAIYAARACPFLANPKMRRRETGLPNREDRYVAGEMIKRNPGVALVWVSRTFHVYRAPNGLLFDVGDPVTTHWFAHGRNATRDEVLASIDSGMPILREAAERSGADALTALDRQHQAALLLVPIEE